MVEFSVSESDTAEVKKRCKKFNRMTLKQLKEEVKKVDQSDNCVLINHDSLRTKQQILDFLYSWEWCNLKGGLECL